MMIGGFGLVGGAMRLRSRKVSFKPPEVFPAPLCQGRALDQAGAKLPCSSMTCSSPSAMAK